MEVGFSSDKWDKIKKNAVKWWEGSLGRPLIQARLTGKEPEVPEPELPFHNFTSFYDYSVPVEKIIDAWEYNLSTVELMGDAFPYVLPNFGPGVIASFMGAKLENGNETVWFHPEEHKNISDIKFEYEPESFWFKRIKEIVSAADQRWKGSVQVSMTDLGGNMDILSTFRPSEKLLMDLYDEPDEVKRLVWEAHEVWWKYYKELCECTENNPGYTGWDRIFADKPYYMLQCDFNFMISPEHFEEFARPELEKTSSKLGRCFYHLDGPGQLDKLDSLLEIDGIDGIQWIPGAGAKEIHEWPEVFKKISDAGKLVQVISTLTSRPLEALDIIADQTGRADNIMYDLHIDFSKKGEVEKLLDKWGVG